jgi:hypothetical protein
MVSNIIKITSTEKTRLIKTRSGFKTPFFACLRLLKKSKNDFKMGFETTSSNIIRENEEEFR